MEKSLVKRDMTSGLPANSQTHQAPCYHRLNKLLTIHLFSRNTFKMPPKNRNRNSHHRSSAYVPSDYDTDTAYATDAMTSIPAAAPIPARTNEELNLSVLQRHDPSVHQILSVAPYAVVYTFNTSSSAWEKQGTEGTLFVCSLLPPVGGPQIERYNVIVLNRRGLENFSSELCSVDSIEDTDDYVILQVDNEDGSTDIFGLWIFAEEGGSTAQAKVVNSLIIQECAKRAQDSRDAAAMADVEEEYTEEEMPRFREQQQQQVPPILQEQEQQRQSYPQAQPQQHQPQSQQVSLLDLFKGGQQQQHQVPSLASPFPSQSQHQYFPVQHQQQHPQQQFQTMPQHQQHQQFSAMQQHQQHQQSFTPPPPGFGQPPTMHPQAQPPLHPQAQADVLQHLFLNARRGY